MCDQKGVREFIQIWERAAVMGKSIILTIPQVQLVMNKTCNNSRTVQKEWRFFYPRTAADHNLQTNSSSVLVAYSKKKTAGIHICTKPTLVPNPLCITDTQKLFRKNLNASKPYLSIISQKV